MATNKEKAFDEITRTWREFQEVLQRVPTQRMDESGLEGGWSVKDIVGHVTTWEVEMMRVMQSYIATRDTTLLQYADVDAFNERTTSEKRTLPLTDLVEEMHHTHEIAVGFVEGMEGRLFDVAQVERRVRVDLYDHYQEHVEQINRWLEKLRG